MNYDYIKMTIYDIRVIVKKFIYICMYVYGAIYFHRI